MYSVTDDRRYSYTRVSRPITRPEDLPEQIDLEGTSPWDIACKLADRLWWSTVDSPSGVYDPAQYPGDTYVRFTPKNEYRGILIASYRIYPIRVTHVAIKSQGRTEGWKWDGLWGCQRWKDAIPRVAPSVPSQRATVADIPTNTAIEVTNKRGPKRKYPVVDATRSTRDR